MTRRVVIIGNGQLAWELLRAVPDSVECVQLTRKELDMSQVGQVAGVMDEVRPDAVINAAAYTAVDKAEQERELAQAVNATGVAALAECCRALDAYLLHVSTDFVFNGSASRPYSPDSPRDPLRVYGATKAAGERAIEASRDRGWCIIRTAWVYSSHGNNFVKTMLRLMNDKPALGVVGDQVGTPTWAKGLAQVCWAALTSGTEGVYHWTDAGVASWYDFAVAIQQLGIEKKLLDTAIPISSIATEAYPTPAVRPAFSVLDKSSLYKALPEVEAHHWRAQLSAMMDELAAQAD